MSEGTDARPIGMANHGEVANGPQAVGFSRPQAFQSVGPDDPLYNMTKAKRGYAVIFKMENYPGNMVREGASHDALECTKAFEYLQFEVIHHDDLTKDQFLEKLDNIRTMKLDECDSLVIVFMGHGGKDEVSGMEIIQLIDGKTVPTSELWKPFSADRCPDMAGQPKIYFIQACRGPETERGIAMNRWSGWDSDTVSESDEYVIPLHSDMLMMWASYQEMPAHRHSIDGSVFIQTLCQVLMSDSKREDLLSMLLTVTRKVGIQYEAPEGVKQLPHFSSTLMRKIVFDDEARKLIEMISMKE